MLFPDQVARSQQPSVQVGGHRGASTKRRTHLNAHHPRLCFVYKLAIYMNTTGPFSLLLLYMYAFVVESLMLTRRGMILVVLSLAVLPSSLATVVTDCVAGKYYDAPGIPPDCKDCTAGKYVDLAAQTACKDCAKGKYSEKEGTQLPEHFDGVTEPGCINCGRGKWSDVLGLAIGPSTEDTSCKNCAAGKKDGRKGKEAKKGAIDADHCVDCKAGLWSMPAVLPAGNTYCENCVSGMYSTIVGLADGSKCINCATGKHTKKGSVGSDSEDDCISCVAGKWSDCEGYQPGQWDAATTFYTAFEGNKCVGSSPAVCKDCVAGKWSDVPAQDAETKCKDCVAGKYFETAFQITDVCLDCVAGKWSDVPALDAETKCKDCVAGKYFETAFQITDVCLDCVAGKWSDVPALDAE